MNLPGIIAQYFVVNSMNSLLSLLELKQIQKHWSKITLFSFKNGCNAFLDIKFLIAAHGPVISFLE